MSEIFGAKKISITDHSKTSGVIGTPRDLKSYCFWLDINIAGQIKDLCMRKPKEIIKYLDIGCGAGKALEELSTKLTNAGLKSRTKIVGLDRKYQGNKPSFLYTIGDFETFDPKERYHLITANNMIRYNPRKLELLTKMYDLLDVNGEASITVYKGSIVIEENGKLNPFERSDLLKELTASGIMTMKHHTGYYTLIMKKREIIPGIYFPVKLINVVGICSGQTDSIYRRV
jgi:SAM-dependent methyltransferase